MASCIDVFVVAHPDDDLLFMNPDIVASIRAQRHVAVVYVTAAELSGPTGDDEYWRDRERGILNAYSYMAHGAEQAIPRYASAAMPAGWSVNSRVYAGIATTEYRLVNGAGAISLVFMRLGDYQTQCLWVQGNGCSAFNPNQPGLPYLAYVVDQERAVAREQLVDALEEVILEYAPTYIGTLDATNLNFDELGGAHSAGDLGGYVEYWDHYFVSLFTLTALLRAQPSLPVGAIFASYRGYTVSREPPNLDDNAGCAKLLTFAHYAIFDSAVMPHDTPTSLLADPDAHLAADYRLDTLTSWQTRLYKTMSTPRPASGVIESAVGGCLARDPQSDRPTTEDCAVAPGWTLSQMNRIQLTGTDLCLGIVGAAGYTTRPPPLCGTSPCDPIPPIHPADAVSFLPCAGADEAATMLALDNGQIRTANSRCLERSSDVVSSDCGSSLDAFGHASGLPVLQQTWTVR